MYEGAIQELIDELSRLPGIGPRSAQRIAFHLLDAPDEDVYALADTLRRVKESARFCEVCFNVSQEERCRVCRDPRRDRSQLCVVEESKDVVAIERTNEFRGLYHVLGGSISPIEGRGRVTCAPANCSSALPTERCRRSSSPRIPTPRARPPRRT